MGSYTRRDADFELPFGYEEYERVRGFRPTANDGMNCGWAAAWHGGLWFDPGDRAWSLNGTGAEGVFDLLRAQGFYCFSVEHTPVASNAAWQLQPFNFKLWPGPVLSTLRFLAWLKSNCTWDSEFGPTVLSSSASAINKNRGATYGQSTGANNALYAGVIPPGRFPIDGVAGLETDNFYREDFPQPRVCVNQIGQIDWTQYVFPTDPTAQPQYRDDLHQALATKEGVGPWLNWSTTPLAVKRAMSPLFWMMAGYPGAKNVSYYHRYINSAGPEGANLAGADFIPNDPKDDFAGFKAFVDPHHRFQLYGASKYWTLAGIPNRCMLSNKLVTYDKATGTWTQAADPVGDISADIANYILAKTGS